MSKQHTRISESPLRIIAIILMVGGCMTLFTNPSVAQEKGFSIFESAETSSSDAPVVAPKEAFTNPVAKLPKSQFGSFGNGSTTTASSKPQLNGSKPGGTYAQDGRSMFRQPPAVQSKPQGNGQLQPFSPNSLRADNRPKPDNKKKIESQPAPLVAGDFQGSARPLAPAATNRANAQPTQPKVAQVAFQDGGFNPNNRKQGESTASRFGQSSTGQSTAGQSTRSRFDQSSSSTPNRFSNNAPQSRQAQPQSNTQPGSRRTTFGQLGGETAGQTGAQRRQPGAFTPRAGQNAAPTARNDFSNMRTRQNTGNSQPRTAANNRPMQPINRRANPVTPTTNNSNKTNNANNAGSQAAKELLGKWAQANPELELPGKQLKLHEFLAQPINGSRKDAINQYWVTFGDMANHKLAIEQSQWLSSISAPRQQTDQAVLKAAQQDAQNRVLHTEIQLAKSQSLLGDFLPNLRYKNGKNIPVLPSDTPWVGKLNTKLAEYQARGIVPARFNAIDDILPKARQLIANRADSVNAASQTAQQAKTALSNGQSPVANVLEAARMKDKNQRDFLSNVTSYNRAITDYVLSVRQDINQPKRLASVLIGRKSVQPSVAQSERRERPEEDDSVLNEANPTLRQVSSGQRIQSQQSQNLTGTSAYQDQGQSQASGLQATSNSLSPVNSTQPTAPAKSSFAYGPTKESAAAANFDPAKVKAELPMQQAKAKGTSPGYSGGVAGGNGGNRNGRTANLLGQPQATGSAPQARSAFSQNRRQSQNRNFNSPAKSGGFNQASSAAPATQRSTFPPRTNGDAAAEKTPAIPNAPVSNPFSQTKSDPTAGANTTGRINRSFGSGGFQGGGAQQPGATASRFGNGTIR